MSASFTSSGQVESTGSGTITALNGVVTVFLPTSSSMTAVITGTWVASLTIEGSADGTTWVAIPAVSLPDRTYVTSITANTTLGLQVGGYNQVRLRASAFTSGTASVAYNVDSTPNVILAPEVLYGATDQTAIGNLGDRLKVDATLPALTGSSLRFLDMNASTGGVARGTGVSSTTVYTTIFSVTGSGYLSSFLVSLEGNLVGADAFNVRLEIDGTVCFTISTDDVGTNTIYNLLSTGDEVAMGMSISNNVFRYVSFPSGSLKYSASVKIYVKKVSSTASKQFRAGAVHLTV